jgi:predicted SnoaL-like aldol condensation-catalyzing enzyme
MAAIETITLRLNDDASAEAFAAANAKVEAEYLPLQSGFNAGTRVTTVDETGEWTISLRWDSARDADASMASFMDAPATQDFLALMDASSMVLDRRVEVASAASPGLANAQSLYLEGIRDGDVRRAVEAYTGDRYTQHSTGVRDGVEGFVEFFEPFVKNNPVRDIELVRSVVDGRFVFIQAAQELNDGAARWITTDLFDTDGNGKIIEHWDVIHEWGGTNPGGHNQVDGATEITDLHLTEENKEVVRRLMTEAFWETPTAPFSDFISAETYINHNPDAPDGLETLEMMDRNSRETGEALFYREVHQIIGQGNFVVCFAHQVWNSIEYAAFGAYRRWPARRAGGCGSRSDRRDAQRLDPAVRPRRPDLRASGRRCHVLHRRSGAGARGTDPGSGGRHRGRNTRSARS